MSPFLFCLELKIYHIRHLRIVGVFVLNFFFACRLGFIRLALVVL